jgi:hypothetical protein
VFGIGKCQNSGEVQSVFHRAKSSVIGSEELGWAVCEPDL